ncbi:MAG TPA: DegT/DnrJ/EryC1/StrS family aminotransferase [Gemmatimonadaceae bacterium]|nr:DegT/DnrJ/EryC1/StrS family aminotransferase [Gemmatimonadaceae bacterium]
MTAAIPASQSRRQIGVGGFRTSARAKQLVNEVLDSNRLTAGPMMSRFEKEIASLHGCRYGLMCDSGTAALQIALGALKESCGWSDGDEVLVPAITFVATANVVVYNNLRPVFVDVDPKYFTLDPSQIEKRITSRTRAIIPVHIGCLPCDMSPIVEISRAHGLRIVEDSAEAMFALCDGKPVGSFGDIACFSTYAAHMITTGVGGLCISNDGDLVTIMKSLMNHGRDSIYIRIDDDEGKTGEELFRIADSRFSFVRMGHSFRCTEMEAAVGIAQLDDRHEHWACRQSLAGRMLAGLAKVSDRLQLPSARPGSDHGYMFFPLVLRRDSDNRSELIHHLEEHGVETRYLLPLINQPAYRKMFGNLDHEYPVAARLNEFAFYVGCHPEMSDADADYIVDCLESYFAARG